MAVVTKRRGEGGEKRRLVPKLDLNVKAGGRPRHRDGRRLGGHARGHSGYLSFRTGGEKPRASSTSTVEPFGSAGRVDDVCAARPAPPTSRWPRLIDKEG